MMDPTALVHAVLVCSDEDCEATYEAFGPLEEIEAWMCDCDCSLTIVGGPYDAEASDGPPRVDLVAVAS